MIDRGAHDTMARKKATAIALAVGTTAALALIPGSAQAYTHAWNCSLLLANTRCYDTTGVIYNPWNNLAVGSNVAKSEVCVKAITAAGNLRSTTTGSTNASYCAFNSTGRGIVLSSPTPNSQGYVYWNGSGSNPYLSGGAQT